MNAGELVISLLLKSGGFKTQVQDAQKDLDKTGDAGQQAMKKTGDAAQKAGKELEGAALKGAGGFGRLLPVLGKTVALLGGMAALKGMASHYLDTAAAIDRTSRSLGMNMQRLQAWQGAAQTVGVEAEEVGNFFRDFNDYIVDANKFDSGPLKDIAKELGIGLQDARRQARATEDVVMDLADAFQRVGNQQATAYGMQLSLDPGMIALMQRGGKELGGLLKAQKELAVYQEEDAELARKMNIAWQTLTKGLEAGGAQIMRVVGSPLAWLAEKLSASVVWMRDNQTFVTAFFTVLAGILLKLGIPAMLSFAKATMAAMAPLMPLVAIVTAAALAFDDLWAFITGGDSALERFALKLGVSQETIESVREALRSVVGFFLDLWDAVTGEGKNADAAWDRVKATWDHALAYFAGILARIKAWFSGLFDSVKQGLLDMIPAGLKSMLGWDDSEESAKKTAQAYQSAMDTTGVVPLAAMRGMATAGDLARGAAGTVDNSRTVSSTTSIGQITVQTQAEDAPGIARDMDGAIRNRTAQIDPAYGR